MLILATRKPITIRRTHVFNRQPENISRILPADNSPKYWGDHLVPRIYYACMIKLVVKRNKFGVDRTNYNDGAWHYRRLNSQELGTWDESGGVCVVLPD